MDIKDMHTLFRTIGQQKGLQQVRAILPDEIDVYLNAAILEKCRSVVLENASTAFQDKVSLQQNPISPINVLRTLYETSVLTSYNISSLVDGVEYNLNQFGVDEKAMFYTSIAVKYVASKNPRQCRIIEFDKLYNTISDYCNSPSKEYPIASFVNKQNVSKVLIINGEDAIKINIGEVLIEYIKYPAKVKFSNDDDSVDCDLPSHIHTEIVELAVNKFFQSVGSTTQQVK